VATAEFLFDRERRFWFLEINTRLQVEHGVTELVADVDLVREQLWLAAGRPLSRRIRDAATRAGRPVRHAIEVRISAEDPGRAFAPTPGTIERWEMPAGPGIRVDTAAHSGMRVPPDYDPLLAKLMVVDETRDAAIDRLARALDETAISGIQTTLPFHRWIVSDEGFRAADLSIDTVDEVWEAIARARRSAALGTARWVAAAAYANGPGPNGAEVTGSGPGPGGGDRRSRGLPAIPPAGQPVGQWAQVGRARAVARWPR